MENEKRKMPFRKGTPNYTVTADTRSKGSTDTLGDEVYKNKDTNISSSSDDAPFPRESRTPFSDEEETKANNEVLQRTRYNSLKILMH